MSKLSWRELEELHDEMLDDCCELITIGTLTYLPSDVLKSTDPIAYRCSLNECIDCLVSDGQLFELHDEYYYSEPTTDSNIM